MRFGIRALLFFVGVAAVFCAVFCAAINWVRSIYYVQLRAVNSVLSEYPEIDKVWLGTNDDIELEVEEVFFSTISDPGLIYRSAGIDTVDEFEFRMRLLRALREKRPVQLPSYATSHRR